MNKIFKAFRGFVFCTSDDGTALWIEHESCQTMIYVWPDTGTHQYYGTRLDENLEDAWLSVTDHIEQKRCPLL